MCARAFTPSRPTEIERFAALPQQQQRGTASLLLPAFSDDYRLDQHHAVAAVLTSSRGSRVFPGFSFASSPLQSLLAQRRSDSSTSAISHDGFVMLASKTAWGLPPSI